MRAPERLRSLLAGLSGRNEDHRLLLLLIILVALALRFARLAFQPLWWDEGWSLYFATSDMGAILELTAIDIHPPFYYLLLHLWIKIFGSSVFSVRLLSVLLGTATVPLLYATGRRLLGARGGLLAALLLAIAPFHIYYSQEVRMYGLVTLLGLVAFYLALRREWGGGSGQWVVWLGYVLAATAALYTEYYAAFLLLALNTSALIRWLRVRDALRTILPWLAAQVAVVLLYLPWLWYAGDRLVTYVEFKVGVEKDLPLGLFTYMSRHLAAFGWGHAEGILAGWWWLGLLPLAMLFVSLASLYRRRALRARFGSWLLETGHWPLTIVVVVLVCGFAVNLAFPFNPPRLERLLLLALPAYLLLVSAGLLALWHHRRWLAILSAASFVVVAALSLAFFYTIPRYPDDDYRPLATRLRALALPRDALIAVHPWQVGYLQAYIPADERPTVVLTPREVLPQERQLWADHPLLMASDLDALLAEHGRLWLPAHQTMGRVLESRVEAYLNEHAYPVLGEWHGDNTVLSLYAAGDPAIEPVTARFGEWLALDSAALDPGPLQAGWGIVTADLTWRLLETPDDRYQVGLRLVDGMDHVWAQRDSKPSGGQHHFSEWPVDEPQADRHGLLIPAGTPPGEYSLTLHVYRSHDVMVLPVASEGGSSREVTLGTVRVVRPETPPPVEALAPAQPLRAGFGDRLRLLGFSVDSDAEFRPGDAVEMDLFWQALSAPGEDFLPYLQLLDDGGASVAELTEKPVAGTYPTAWWRAGELVRDPHALAIPATVPAGRYDLVLSLVRPADRTPVEVKGGESLVELAEIKVRDREHLFRPTSPEHPQLTRFGPFVELEGYDLREVVRAPGSPLEVSLHWHVLETPDRGYHTFVHLLDADGEIVAQHDGSPGEGELPALGWLPGEFLVDTHLLQLPFDLSDGVYQLGVGLYDPATGQRLGERLLLSRPIPVEAPGGCICR
jgi:4-amino-4-deoxy-L-arabinose transferase-like glycosyltransferase